MKIINSFVLKNLLLNKKRTIVTIIGIMLSTALICAVGGMVTSTRQTIINTIIDDQGNYHVGFLNVNSQDVDTVTQNNKVKNWYITSVNGIARLENSQNEYKPYIAVLGFNDNALENNALKLIEGRMPVTDKEVVISEHIKTNGGVTYGIGEKIVLNIGRRIDENGNELDNNAELIENENIVETSTTEYTVVGIIQRTNYATEGYASPCYTMITKLANDFKTCNVYVRFENPLLYSEISDEICQSIECKMQNNTQLLRYEGAVSEQTMNVLYGIAAVVIVIIVVSSVFVIRNSFAISVMEKNKQFGMLASIGATPKQIKKSVILEGAYIGLVAIPLGILCGIIAIVVLLMILNSLLGTMLNGVSFVYSVPFEAIILTIAVSVITIFLSCIIPAIRASKISPIESIRGNNDVKIKAKKLKTSKFIHKIFGIGGVIASKNLKRSKKKYRTTIISLVVSIAIFISLSTFVNYGKKVNNLYYTNTDFNICVFGNEQVFNELENGVLKGDDIVSYAKYAESSMTFDATKYATQYLKDKKGAENVDNINLNIIIANKEYFSKYLQKIGLKESDNMKAVLIDENLEYLDNNKKALYNSYTLKAGDTIDVIFNQKNMKLNIATNTDVRPMGYEGYNWVEGCIVVSEELIAMDEGYVNYMYIQATDANAAETNIQKVINESADHSGVSVTNIETYVDQINRLYLVISIFLYGFVTVITLIGVTNIFNTITTNMLLRSKEFAMLKSIGMTKNEFNKMIRLESLLYGLKSLVIGLPIGTLGSYFMYLAFKESIDLGFSMPWDSILICVVAVFLIVFLTMQYSLRNINKQNIIEAIRQENT